MPEQPELFVLDDMVTWREFNPTTEPVEWEFVNTMKKECGEGPFKVLGVHSVEDEAALVHPQVIQLFVPAYGMKQAFSAHWFTAYKPRRLN